MCIWCVYIYMCVYVCSIYVYTYMCVMHMYVCMYIFMCMCTCICACVYMCWYVYIYIYVYICVCMYMYICALTTQWAMTIKSEYVYLFSNCIRTTQYLKPLKITSLGEAKNNTLNNALYTKHKKPEYLKTFPLYPL